MGDTLYRDPGQGAQSRAARIPAELAEFAQTALEKALHDPLATQRALGEYLSEPKAQVWFQGSETGIGAGQGVRLDRRSTMLYDDSHVFINGESFLASGRDAALMRSLADAQFLTASDVHKLSSSARGLLTDWVGAGWVCLQD